MPVPVPKAAPASKIAAPVKQSAQKVAPTKAPAPASKTTAPAIRTKSSTTTSSTTTSSSAPTRGASPPKTNGGGGNGSAAPPPPPPPPAPAPAPAPVPAAATPPTVAATGPSGSMLVSLAIFAGGRFKDHWAFFVRKTKTDQKGILLHAQGDPRNGFTFEIKRNIDFAQTSRRPVLIDLAWVASSHFNAAMWNNNVYKVEAPGVPVCPFETTAHSAPVPAATLNAVDDTTAATGNPPRRIRQRNCQTWIIEAADKLLLARMFTQAVIDFLNAKKQ